MCHVYRAYSMLKTMRLCIDLSCFIVYDVCLICVDIKFNLKWHGMKNGSKGSEKLKY